MLKSAALVIFALAVQVLFAPVSSAASQCPPGKKLECRPQSEAQKQKSPPPCRCVSSGQGGTGSYGKAEIKRKNVPQVKPNKVKGPAD